MGDHKNFLLKKTQQWNTMIKPKEDEKFCFIIINHKKKNFFFFPEVEI
jgi:hypothetical protein